MALGRVRRSGHPRQQEGLKQQPTETTIHQHLVDQYGQFVILEILIDVI